MLGVFMSYLVLNPFRIKGAVFSRNEKYPKESIPNDMVDFLLRGGKIQDVGEEKIEKVVDQVEEKTKKSVEPEVVNVPEGRVEHVPDGPKLESVVEGDSEEIVKEELLTLEQAYEIYQKDKEGLDKFSWSVIKGLALELKVPPTQINKRQVLVLLKKYFDSL
jgi:hypothetical protein